MLPSIVPVILDILLTWRDPSCARGLLPQLSRDACYCRAAPKSFSRNALLFRVIPANIAVDFNQKEKRLHFDNSTFSAGVELINELWSRIEAGVACMTNFGRLTHTVQDFYSHSNWVELHQHLAPIPVWDLNVESLPAAVLSGTYPSRTRAARGACPRMPS